MLKLLIAAALGAALSSGVLAQHGGHSSHSGKAETPFGQPGDPKKVSRTVEIDMSDRMRFAPAEIQVRRGETVRFRVKNSGQTLHEMVIGTPEGLKKHAEDMRKHPGMKHDAPNLTHVGPGKSGTIVWRFDKAGEFQYACLVPGHFEAGMVGRIRVVADSAQADDLKSLSADDVKQYLSGAGMGYAKAAELNHFPGPMHALELADRLGLSAEQRTATKALMDAHKAEARGIGAKLVDAERAIEVLFRGARIDEEALAAAVRTAAALQGEYRLAHLDTHRRMRALLTPDQVKRYDELRGYAGAGEHSHKKH